MHFNFALTGNKSTYRHQILKPDDISSITLTPFWIAIIMQLTFFTRRCCERVWFNEYEPEMKAIGLDYVALDSRHTGLWIKINSRSYAMLLHDLKI